MIIRQTFNFAVHLAAGVAFGLLVVAACKACRNGRCQMNGRYRPRSVTTSPVPDPNVTQPSPDASVSASS